MPRSVALLTIVLLSACDSGTDPGAANRVFGLTRADSSILVFTGTRVSLRDLFAATDIYGQTVADAHFSCALPAGFTRTGDSLLAPATETRGALTCSATTVPNRVFATYPVDAMTLTAATDLRKATWRVSWSCTGGFEGYGVGSSEDPIDEVRLDGRITEIRYATTEGLVRNWGGAAPFVWAGRQTLYRNGAVVRSDSAIIGWVLQVARQAPDTLFAVNGFRLQRTLMPMLRATGTSSRRYGGADFCRETQQPLMPVVMEEVR